VIVTSVAAARAVWLFDLQDMNPTGRYLYDELFPWLMERYRFAKAPAHARDQVEHSWEFLNGRFVTQANEPIDVTLRIYNDGVVGETHSSTSDTDAFLADALAAAAKELNLTFADSMVYRKTYVSELNLLSEKNLQNVNSGMQAFSEAVSKAFGIPFQLSALALSGETGAQPTFRFERKANHPFAQNKYWSIAGLETSVHVALLEQLERLLAD